MKTKASMVPEQQFLATKIITQFTLLLAHWLFLQYYYYIPLWIRSPSLKLTFCSFVGIFNGSRWGSVTHVFIVFFFCLLSPSGQGSTLHSKMFGFKFGWDNKAQLFWKRKWLDLTDFWMSLLWMRHDFPLIKDIDWILPN